MPPLSFGQYINFAGKIGVVISILLIGLSGNLYLRGHDVSVEVTSIGERSTDEGTMFAPAFRVVDGEFAGKRYRVPYLSSMFRDERGDIIDGKYDPLTKRILSNQFALMELALSFVMLGFGLFAGFAQWEELDDISSRSGVFGGKSRPH